MTKVIIDEVKYVPREKEIEIWIDSETGLVWEKQGSYKTLSWKKAVEYAETLRNNWRLPTVQELMTLIDFTKINPACKITNTYSSYYWSYTTFVHGTDYMWYIIGFGYGHINYSKKDNNFYVRCVKGEEK